MSKWKLFHIQQRLSSSGLTMFMWHSNDELSVRMRGTIVKNFIQRIVEDISLAIFLRTAVEIGSRSQDELDDMGDKFNDFEYGDNQKR